MDRKELLKKIKEEKDLYVFKHKGLWCMVKRMGLYPDRDNINLNGYVFLPEDHDLIGCKTWYWIDEEDRDNYKELFLKKADFIEQIEIHGGLTFAGRMGYTIIDGCDFAIGFDTCHGGDIWTITEDAVVYKGRDGCEYRDAEYVIAETMLLAEQISKWDSFKSSNKDDAKN